MAVLDTNYKSLLEDHKEITVDDMRRQAYKTWGKHNATYANIKLLEIIDPSNINLPHLDTFYNRVKSRMIAKHIQGYLKKDDIEVLKTNRDNISWRDTNGIVEEDEPTMLWLFNQCNPFTRVGVSELKEDLRRATSAKHKHNVKNLNDYMGKKYHDILDRNHTHEDDLLGLCNALATVPNESFKSFVRTERQKWELGGTKTAREIISESLTIYSNTVSAHTWTTTDPKDAKIIALATKVDELMKLQAFATGGMTTGDSAGHKDKRDKSKLNHGMEKK